MSRSIHHTLYTISNNMPSPPTSPSSSPTFRFVQMQQQQQPSQQSATIAAHDDTNMIDKNAYFSSRSDNDSQQQQQQRQENETAPRRPSLWNPTELRTVPAFYPLEKSSRLVEDDTPSNVAARLADCLRRLSIQAVYENDTAQLHSSDHVSLHLSLWRTPPTSPQTGIVVELQRRSGDSIAFHRYARSILDAAMGLLDEQEQQGDTKSARSTSNSTTHTTTRNDTEPLGSHPPQYSKKVQRLLRSVSTNSADQEHETALQAIEIAHGLLMKDRMDAQVLGLESLCLLTDPQKAGTLTSVLTAHVVLLGSTQNVHDENPSLPSSVAAKNTTAAVDEGPFVDIRESILNLVQFSRIGQPDGDDDDDDSVATDPPADDEQHLKLLHHLALAVLANALDVLESPTTTNTNTTTPTTTTTPRQRTRSADIVADQFVGTLLPTLVKELGQASTFPHAATLSAKCLGSLVRASSKARRRVQELGTKKVVQTALDVGTATHLRLQLESQRLSQTLADEQPEQQPPPAATVVADVAEDTEEEDDDDDDDKNSRT